MTVNRGRGEEVQTLTPAHTSSGPNQNHSSDIAKTSRVGIDQGGENQIYSGKRDLQNHSSDRTKTGRVGIDQGGENWIYSGK
jgi:hypothetical protein